MANGYIPSFSMGRAGGSSPQGQGGQVARGFRECRGEEGEAGSYAERDRLMMRGWIDIMDRRMNG